MNDQRTFSQRFGFRGQEAEITIREDAPTVVREGLVMLAQSVGLSPHSARAEACGVLLKSPNPLNWTAYPNVAQEVASLVSEAPWYRVYDIAEAFHVRLRQGNPDRSGEFQERLNDLFRENGIGWQMENGRIVVRGSEAFAQAVQSATEVMTSGGKQIAAREMHEALVDISRRPHADITGAIQHAMAALECVARDVSGESSKTLGKIIVDLKLPRPLDEALEKLWGFASEQGRHLREGRAPRFEDAQLVVTVASAVSSYLLRREKDIAS